MCNPESSCVDTREDVHSLKVIMQGHGFTSCEQMSLNSLQSCHFLSLILGIVSHSCNLSAQETWEGGLDQESTTRLDCKRIYPQKILEPHPECCHCHFCVRAADLGNQAAPSSSPPSSPPSLLVSVYFYFVFLQAWGSFPLPCALRAQALLSCISSIHSVFIMCFPNRKCSELMVEKQCQILCVSHAIKKRVQLSLGMLAWPLLELTFDLFLTYFISNFFWDWVSLCKSA